MASIIKNQLLKHLSRYTKNLSSDKINLSTFRGEGDLSNLQLDEDVLTDLLELPPWLKITSAWCDHVLFRIHWTKLKSVPITLILDKVNITLETCELGRAGAPKTGFQSLAAPQGKYSFIHKVIDGITIIVNTVNVNFKSPAFTASVQMSRIRVESKTPKWVSGDLRLTRLKDPVQGLLLIFKELSWQTVRIEASSTLDKTLTPLRLLTNQARCRITIKKKLSDCSILASRLVLILDDLLWVLTDSQLKAALHFVDSLAVLFRASTNVTQKSKAQRKLETLPEYQAQMAQSRQSSDTITALQKSFSLFDVRETSYHFFSQRIDLHLCDDDGDGRSCYPDLRDGGALQISVQGFQVDYYPYHLAKADRSHWPKYKEATVPPALWLEQSLNGFKEAIINLSHPNRPPSHAPLERTPNSPPQNAFTGADRTPGVSNIDKNVLDNLSKLMSSCVVLRIEDFTIYRVTTSGKKQMPKELIAGDKDRYSFPAELSTIHAEFTYFYYPGDFEFPLPPSKAFLYVNPVQVHFDLSSFIWFNSFALNLHESLLRTSVANQNSPTCSPTEPSLMYMDVKLEAIMPRIVFESCVDVSSQRDRPKMMQIQVSRFAVTNIREMGASRADLAQAIHSLQEGTLVFASGFPSKEGDLCIVTDRILAHVAATDVTPMDSFSPNSAHSSLSGVSSLGRYVLWAEPRDVWCVKIDPVWCDFIGARSVGATRSIPFVDAVPITLWVHGDANIPEKIPLEIPKKNQLQREPAPSLILSVNNLSQAMNNTQLASGSSFESFNKSDLHLPIKSVEDSKPVKSVKAAASGVKSADLHVIAHVANLVSVQIDHYQFLFLLRLAEELTELSTFVALDSKRIMKAKSSNPSIIVGCVVPQVEVTLIMPSQTPGKDSSGCDAESFIPDSASLGDDLLINNSANTVWPPTTPPTNIDLSSKVNNPFGQVETPSPLMNNKTVEMHTSNPNTHGHNVQIASAQTSSQQTTVPIQTHNAKSNKSRPVSSDTSFSKDINSGLLSMKKGFTSFMTSIDASFKTNAGDDASDTISIHSNLSSDSENYVMLFGDSDKTADCMDVMFKLNPFGNENTLKASAVEVANEVYEEPDYKTNMSSPSEPSDTSSWRRRDLVSMATFKLTTVEVIRQSHGQNSSLRLQVSAVSCDECGAIPWDELQTARNTTNKTKFGARCRAWNIAPYNPESPPSIKVRMEEELNTPEDWIAITDKKCVLDWFSRKVNVSLKNLALQLTMSTVIGLNDLAEDEILPKPFPMDIIIEDVRLTLIEDRPPVNITSPGSVPIGLDIGRMLITRDDTGVFHLQPDTQVECRTQFDAITKNDDRDRELLSHHLIMQQLKVDNENLKKQLSTVERTGESQRLKTKQDSDKLMGLLKAAQNDISYLLGEKKNLLETIRLLQVQVSSTDRLNKHDGKR